MSYVCAACAQFISVIDSVCPQCKGKAFVEMGLRSMIELMEQVDADMTESMFIESPPSKRQLLVWRNAVKTVRVMLEAEAWEKENEH